MRCADLSDRPARGDGSCVIHLNGPGAGTVYDCATGGSAGQIAPLQHATGLTDAILFAEAVRLAGLVRPCQPCRPTPSRPDPDLEVARILAGCPPRAGTPAEVYLRLRRLADPASPERLPGERSLHLPLTGADGYAADLALLERVLEVARPGRVVLVRTADLPTRSISWHACFIARPAHAPSVPMPAAA